MKQELGSLWDSKLSWWRKIVRLPLRMLPHLTELRVRQGMNCGFRWVTGASINACWLGNYERDKQELASRRVVRVALFGTLVLTLVFILWACRD